MSARIVMARGVKLWRTAHMSTDHSNSGAARRAPSRWDLFMLTMQMHARSIVWISGIGLLTLAITVFGILRTVTVGDLSTHAGKVVDVPSSQSLHVQVELSNGNRVLVARGEHEVLSAGDRVTVSQSSSALGTTDYALTEVLD